MHHLLQPALLLLVVLLNLPVASQAAGQPDEPVVARNGGGILTRFYRDIESQEMVLQKAIASGKREDLDKLLSPAFSLQQSGHELQTAQDLKAASNGLGSVTLLQLHEASPTVLVAVLRSSRYGEALVTDVWQNADGEGWRLRLRVIPTFKP
jgi:hypothetical protein